MLNNTISTEDRIFQAAHHIFSLYGFHGTTLQKIAFKARVNKSVVHYYFRSKERLYGKVVEYVLNSIFTPNLHIDANQNGTENQKWFLYTELYNNEELFKQTLTDLYPNHCDETLKEIKKFACHD